MHPYVHFSIIYNSQDLEAAQVPLSRCMNKKLWYIYIVEYYLVIRKKEMLPFGTALMDLESIMLGEISQSETDKYHMILLMCGI